MSTDVSMAKAKRATPKQFSHNPCVTEDEFVYRIFVVERPVIERMIDRGYPIIEIMNYWSETTGEAHCFPIFKTDSPNDIVNRYCDMFPREVREFSSMLAEHNACLNDKNGMNATGSMAIKMKIPLGLFRAMKALDDDFWNGTESVKRLVNAFPKLMKVKATK